MIYLDIFRYIIYLDRYLKPTLSLQLYEYLVCIFAR